jgi:molybdopterin-containing oxidoreductase family iron-sulfur binding subunit
MSTTKQYWKGLEELSNTSEFVEQRDKEFSEQIPVDEFIGKENVLAAGKSDRRDFLKYLGFSVAAASLAACETPVHKAIPYLNKPEHITPGLATWYASTFNDGHDFASVLVKTREGRPIKIEGNPASPVNMGGLNARVQASVLSLYDSSRVKFPQMGEAATTWDVADAEISQKLKAVAASGKKLLFFLLLLPALLQGS